jgi:L-lactate dehydrogenase complex protein LldF
MGSVLTPALVGVDKAGHLPNASSFCGRCESVCPVRIPLPKLMRHWREREFERHLQPATQRSAMRLWGFFARRPGLYGFATGAAMRALALAGRERGRFNWLPFSRSWTKYRDFPAPQGQTFQQRWARERGKRRAA